MSTTAISFTDDLVSSLGGPGIGPSQGQCPMIVSGPNAGGCYPAGGPYDGSQSVGCHNYRECDVYTGAQHVEYTLPTGVVRNANIWSVDPSTGKLVWLDATGNPATPPNWATPPTLGAGNSFTSGTNPTQVSKIQALGNVVGFNYNPSSGWTPAAGAVPTDNSPAGGSAFAPKNSNPTTPGGSTGGVAPTGVTNLGGTTGQGTGGTGSANTAPPPPPIASGKPNLLLIGAIIVVAILLIK